MKGDKRGSVYDKKIGLQAPRRLYLNQSRGCTKWKRCSLFGTTLDHFSGILSRNSFTNFRIRSVQARFVR